MLRVATMPWWWPIGYAAKTVRETPGRLKDAFLAPYRMWGAGLTLDRVAWMGWSIAERRSVLHQAVIWLVLMAVCLGVSYSLTGWHKLVPVSLVMVAWLLRWRYDVVRRWLPLVTLDSPPD